MSLEGKNILITGITGFVGSCLAKNLLSKNANVYGLARTRADRTKAKNLEDVEAYRSVSLIDGDIANITAIGSALRKSEPDVIFHLAAKSYVPRSFENPLEIFETNSFGTANLLEAIRLQRLNPVVVFAGSSEEYGLVFFSEDQYQRATKKYGVIFPEPENFPEVPINEGTPLRPISPYAVSKMHGEYMMRNYSQVYGLRTIVSRAFNHEGAGRGINFVTALITSQVMKFKLHETDKITIGNVNSFRDWSHVLDTIEGYCLLAEKGRHGDVYVQGSMRTNSVLSYILLSLQEAGWEVEKIESMKNGKILSNPTEEDSSAIFGLNFTKTKLDKNMLHGELEFSIEDEGIWVHTNKGKIPLVFDKERFREADVPLLLSDTRKIQSLGFKVSHSLKDIINDQLDYFSRKENRNLG